jgi:hypothetical protein
MLGISITSQNIMTYFLLGVVIYIPVDVQAV